MFQVCINREIQSGSIRAGLAARYDFAEHFYQHHFTVTVWIGATPPLLRGLPHFGSTLPSACPSVASLKDKGQLLPNICVLQSDTTYSFSADLS